MSNPGVQEHERCQGVYPSGRQCPRRFVKYDGASLRTCGGDHVEPWVGEKKGYRRNMPCECGSGAKAKRCCMGAKPRG